MAKWKCESNACKFAPCVMEMNNDILPTCCVATTGIFAKWQEVKGEEEPVTTCNQFPKLTAEVFDRSDCPDWVKYAVVNEDGRAFFVERPIGSINGGWDYTGMVCSIPGIFDSTDWKNSLIERPAKLPDWCKVSEWVYIPQRAKYAKIHSIKDEVFYQSVSGGITSVKSYTELIQAHLRPYNAKEMEALVGKVLHHSTGSYLVTAFEARWGQVKIESVWRDADELKEVWTWPDGSHCGVLEHLENGEWVE